MELKQRRFTDGIQQRLSQRPRWSCSTPEDEAMAAASVREAMVVFDGSFHDRVWSWSSAACPQVGAAELMAWVEPWDLTHVTHPRWTWMRAMDGSRGCSDAR